MYYIYSIRLFCIILYYLIFYSIVLYYIGIRCPLLLLSMRPVVLRMAAEDKHLPEAAAGNLSPGQLLSLFKMEPKTLGVSRAARLHHRMSRHFWGRPLPPSRPRSGGRQRRPSQDGSTLQSPSAPPHTRDRGPSDLTLRAR